VSARDTDRSHLTRTSYAGGERLERRIRTHRLHARPPGEFADWVLERVPWSGGERVLDVGCGSALYAEPVRRRGGRWVGCDLSEGMLRSVSGAVDACLVGDAQALGLRSGCADVILANHVLYHVPDRDAALRELGRVLAPGGLLLAGTNGSASLQEVRNLPVRALERLGHARVPFRLDTVERFSLENGRAQVARRFEEVDLHEQESALVFREPEPLVAYLDSMSDWYEPQLPAGVAWPEVREALRDLIAERIAQEGAFRSPKRAGVFVCSSPRSAP
jgi:SAM-dependent methyltransferase